MFTNAIDKVSAFTRPIHIITRNYDSSEVLPGAATMFFINDEGYALTCRHVVEASLALEEIVNNKYINFKQEYSLLPQSGNKKRTALKALETKYGYSKEVVIQLKNLFINCGDSKTYQWFLHPLLDLALIKFNDFTYLDCNEFPIFLKDSSQIKPGRSLCRLGYPFPEFNNYQYNTISDDIEWIEDRNVVFPHFPIDGMVTRFAADNGKVSEIEMSTPGLKGQSGGPLFDKDGVIYGMQSTTIHLHLGFDIEKKEVLVDNKKKNVSDYSFIHLGRCIHIDIIKEFMRSNNVKFQEA